MNITVFGASGGIGKILVGIALENGDTVTAYVRDKNKLGLEHDNLHVIQGELKDAEKIEQAVGASDIVISALGPNMKLPKSYMETPVADGHRLIIQAMQRLGKKRLITLATPSVHANEDPKKLMFSIITFMAKHFLTAAYRDIIKTGEEVKNSSLDWTIVRIINPNLSTSGNGYATSIGSQPFKMGVSRENAAKCMYDLAVDQTFVHQMPIVFNKQ